MISGLHILIIAGFAGVPPCEGVISGQVLDAQKGQVLSRARIDAGESVTPVRTDAQGRYRVSGLCPGPLELRVVRSGYALKRVRVNVKNTHTIDIKLNAMSVVQGDEIHVQAPRLKESDTRSVVSLDGDTLLRTRGENLADALANLPGVSVLRNGSTAKPVVRGQYGSRVLKLFDGVRHEGQDWALDHGPEIDTFASGSMRVVKGSAGVRYGPDAIAGVLLIDPPEVLKEPGMVVHTHSVGALNGKRGTLAARIDGNHSVLPGLSWRLDGNYSRGAGLETPDYPLDNTGIEETNFGGLLEYSEAKWNTKLSFRRNEKRNGLCLCVRNETASDFDATLQRDRPVNSDLYRADYEIERPSQSVTHEILLARARLDMDSVGELETTYAYQLNDRDEYDIIRVESSRPQFMFELRTHTLDLTLEHVPVDIGPQRRVEGLLGVSGVLQKNIYEGLPLLSDYESMGGGVFAIERLIMGHFEVEGGLRYDYQTRQAFIPEKTYESLMREGRISDDQCSIQERASRCDSQFHAGTVSLGGLLRISDAYVTKVDLSSATRMPTIDEQYISGTSPSFPIMARGQGDLGPETSWSLSGTFETHLPWLSSELSVYGSWIDDYIYLRPELRADGTVRTDTLISGRYPRFAYEAINAVFYGADANAKMRLGRFDIGVQGSLVRATEADTGEFLLFIPSDRMSTELTYNPPAIASLVDSYMSVNAQWVARQSNVSPSADFAPVPDGYVLFGGRIGTAFETREDRYTLDLEIQNALNTRYRDYTSMLRYYADEPGRQVFLRFGTELDF